MYTKGRGGGGVRTFIGIFGTCTLIRHQCPGVLGSMFLQSLWGILSNVSEHLMCRCYHLTNSWCRALCIKLICKIHLR